MGLFRKVLVIGENHEEIIHMFSKDKAVEPYVKYKREDAGIMKKRHLAFIEAVINSGKLELTNDQRDRYKEIYLSIKEMSDSDYYLHITEGCVYDKDTGDALSTENPNAYYQYEKCYERRFKETGEEAPLITPFILKDGTRSYSARKGDIDWSKNHMYGTDIYEVAWDIIVDGRSPETPQEEKIKEVMPLNYFQHFKTKEEYVRHCCAFWAYGVATSSGYAELDYTIQDKVWVAEFYDRFIKGLSDDTLLTLYEVKGLSN